MERGNCPTHGRGVGFYPDAYTFIMRCPLLAVLVAGFMIASGGQADGELIDGMENSSLWNQTGVDGAATLSVSNTTGYIGNGVQGTYDLKTGSWIVFGRKFESVDISSGDAVSFLYKGTGSKNNIEVKLMDSGGDWFATTLTNVSDTSQWTRAILPFKTGSTVFSFSYMEGGTGGDSTLTTSAIKKFGFAVSKGSGGSGTVLFDDLSVYQKAADTIILFVDNFEDGANPNVMGGSSTAVYVDPVGTTLAGTYDAVNSRPDTGLRTLRIDFVKSSVTTNAALVLEMGASGASTDISSCTEIVFDIRGSAGGEQLGVGLKSPEKVLPLNTYLSGGVTTSWQRVRIPFTAFTGFTPATGAGMTLWFQSSGLGITGSAAETIWIDNVHAFRCPVLAKVIDIVDSFESPASVSGWSAIADANASASIDRTTGNTGNAMRLTYDITTGNWVVANRKAAMNLQGGSAFQFMANGTGGANNLEFKVKDDDGTTFYKILSAGAYSAGGWKTYTIPYTELVYTSAGSDRYLNLASISEIYFAVSKGSSTSTSGTVIIDGLSYVSSPSLNNTYSSSGGVIEEMNVSGNPVSPNGDGVDDLVTFQYKLRESANVTIDIYDVRGNVVRKINGGTQGAGTQSMTWDVQDKSGGLVRNGLCIFRFNAKSAVGSGESDIRNIIAVVR